MAFVTPTYILVWFYGQNAVTVGGNLIILVAIYRDRRLRSKNDVLVANLGVYGNSKAPHPEIVCPPFTSTKLEFSS